MKKVLTTGYPSMDRIVKLDKTPLVGYTSIVLNQDSNEIYYGGCSLNISTILGKLNVPNTPLIRVGKDFEQIKLGEHLKKHNVDLSGIMKVDDKITSFSYLLQTESGDHVTLFHPGAHSDENFVNYNEELFKDARMVVMTINSKSDNDETLRLAKKYDVPLAFGMKLDETGFTDDVLEKVFTSVEIMFANAHETDVLCNKFNFNGIKDFFKLPKMEIFVVTKGGSGSTIYTKKGEIIEIPVVAPKRIIDTAGAGDAYMAGFLYGYLNDLGIEKAGRIGSVVSSFILEELGCTTNAPTLAQVKERYNKNFKGDKL